MSASRAAARSRFLFSGAGATVLLPPADTDAGAGAEREDAYLVAPAAHIGRVVTGVVLVAERGGGAALRELAASASAGAAARFGLTTVSFADKLAEQGYKVLVLDLFPGQYPQRASPDWPAVQRLGEQAAAQTQRLAAAVKYLQQHDVQRVGLLGVGAGADFAIKIAMERLAVVDCAVALSPHGVLPWTPASELAASQHGDQAEDVSKEEEESKSAEPTSTVVPLLLLIGEKTPYANSDAVSRPACVLNGCSTSLTNGKMMYTPVPEAAERLRCRPERCGGTQGVAVREPGHWFRVLQHHGRRRRDAGHRRDPGLACDALAPVPLCGVHQRRRSMVREAAVLSQPPIGRHVLML